ncbi:transposase [Acinetobacter baumannii]|uniref:transposase n=1 Tax=Acinetobacter baumannii TaxID=470 RepID=UPI0038B69ABA
MINKFNINIGDRFSMNYQNFEICYIDHELIRYANFDSSQMHFITFDSLISKISTKEIIYNSLYINKLHPNHRTPIEDISKYLNYFFENNISCSKKHLRIAIEQISLIYPEIKIISDSTFARYIKKYRDNFSSYEVFYAKPTGNTSLRFPIYIENIITEVLLEIIKEKGCFTAIDAHLEIKGKILQIDKDATIPTLRTIYRRLERSDPYQKIRNKKGKRFSDKLFRASGQSLISTGLMSIVEIDTQPVDCKIIDENGILLGTAWICIIIEVYTRVIAGWHVCTLPPCSIKTLHALKNMISAPTKNKMGGIPTHLIPDNGTEFKNNTLANFCNAFKITKCESETYRPDNKPHIERFFRTINHNVFHKLSGTTHSSYDKRGEYNSEKLACYSLDQIRQLTEEFIENIYHKSIHSATGERPATHWNKSKKLCAPLYVSEIETEHKCRHVYRYKISKGQINFKGLRYKSHALATLEYKFKGKVTVYVNHLKLCHIFIQDPYDASNLIRADSILKKYTENLSLDEYLQSKVLLREYYKLDIQEIENEDLLFLGRLHFSRNIRALNKQGRKFKSVDDDISPLINKLAKSLNLVASDGTENSDSKYLEPSSSLIHTFENDFEVINFEE